MLILDFLPNLRHEVNYETLTIMFSKIFKLTLCSNINTSLPYKNITTKDNDSNDSLELHKTSPNTSDNNNSNDDDTLPSINGDDTPVRTRRFSVSAETFTHTSNQNNENHINNNEISIFKSPESIKKIKQTLNKYELFNGLCTNEIDNIVNKMNKIDTKPNENIIKEGDKGDNFYVVEAGIFEVYKNDKNDKENYNKKLKEYENEGCFGELALMHGSPRTASVTSKTKGILWSLNGEIFRKVVVLSRIQQTKKINSILNEIDFFKNLTVDEKKQMSQTLSIFRYYKNDHIFTQNEIGKRFYIILNGEVSVLINDNHITNLTKGSYFGERSLILNEKRSATIECVSEIVEVASMTKETFSRLINDKTLKSMQKQFGTYK